MEQKTSVELILSYLAYRRKDFEISLYEISDKSGLSISYLSRVFAGKIPSPSLSTLFSLAKAFDLSIHELLDIVIKNEDEQDEKGKSIEELILTNDVKYNGEDINPNQKRYLIEVISLLFNYHEGNDLETIVSFTGLLLDLRKSNKLEI